jgi:threonine 3-dehydrogenase
MKALIFNKKTTDWEGSKGFDLEDVPKPELESGDENKVIIKVHFAGVCGSDRGIWYRQAFRDQILGSLEAEGRDARTIGHEHFGEVVEVGSKVSRVKVGDFVSAESHVVCNECFQCKNGQKNVCTNEKILGISHQGIFAEFVKLPEHIVWPTDTTKIRAEVAAVQEPFGNAVHAASKVNLKGKTVAIFGLGPIGLFLVLVARGMGAKSIIGVEPNPIAQEMARKLGIDYVISVSKTEKEKPYLHDESVTEEIMKITGGLGVDVSFEMAGFNSSVNNCLYATRRGGDVVLFGIKTGDFVFEDFNRMIVHGFTIHNVIGREVFETWETTKKLLQDPTNHIQEKIWNVILQQGKGTVLPIEEYTKEKFEQLMLEHPKMLIKF